VLDASAVLALLVEEPGADEVESVLDGALMSSVNLSEVLQKGEQLGSDVEGLEFDLEALGVEFRTFDALQSRVTADIWARAPSAGLSIGDRACLALTELVEGTAVTTDRRWAEVQLAIPIRVVR
jgi:PIN domain nuclease of toxin-antitoxin system